VRAWGVVVCITDVTRARGLASFLRTCGYRAKALYRIQTQEWEVCVSPAEQSGAARDLIRNYYGETVSV